jgi:hypothetical protein
MPSVRHTETALRDPSAHRPGRVTGRAAPVPEVLFGLYNSAILSLTMVGRMGWLLLPSKSGLQSPFTISTETWIVSEVIELIPTFNPDASVGLPTPIKLPEGHVGPTAGTSDRGDSMRDRYPYQSVGPSQRDYQELLASFRELSDERNALRSIVEQLHEALEGVRDTRSPRSQLRAV